jgi:hypothetical protein
MKMEYFNPLGFSGWPGQLVVRVAEGHRRQPQIGVLLG